jgi:hypothetical protein
MPQSGLLGVILHFTCTRIYRCRKARAAALIADIAAGRFDPLAGRLLRGVDDRGLLEQEMEDIVARRRTCPTLQRRRAGKAMTSLIFIGSRRATGRTTTLSLSAPRPQAWYARVRGPGGRT